MENGCPPQCKAQGNPERGPKKPQALEFSLSVLSKFFPRNGGGLWARQGV